MVVELDEICGAYPEQENQPAGASTADLKPEFIQYKDEGCRYAVSCLECPYPECLYEKPHYRKHRVTEVRNKEINRLFRSGRSVKELALLFAVSQRTVSRAVKKAEKE
jgi:hypothetical protein